MMTRCTAKIFSLLLVSALSFVAAPDLLGQQEGVSYGRLGLNFGYSYQLPAGDLADRFGGFNGMAGELEYISPAKSVILGLSGQFFFGDKVEEDPIAFLRDPLGNLAAPGQVAVPVFLRMRGLYLGGHVGKLFQLTPDKRKSNIRVTLGMGLLQHRIRFKDDSDGVNILYDESGKGLDRLTNGLALRQQLGYQHMDHEGYKQFYVGLEFTQAFTQGRRSYDYQSQSVLDDSRTDLMVGIKFMWTLPLIQTATEKGTFYY